MSRALLCLALASLLGCDDSTPPGGALDGALDATPEDRGPPDDGALPEDGPLLDAMVEVDGSGGEIRDLGAEAGQDQGPVDLGPDAELDQAAPDEGPDADLDLGPDAAPDVGPEPDLAVEDMAADMPLGECEPGEFRGCGTDVGRCQAGLRICADDRTWGPCLNQVAPAGELCNGQDDDCDGQIDEAISRPCEPGPDACRLGTQWCEAGAWGACEGGAVPGQERCDGLDDDCDGAIDEGLTRACGGGQGACAPGVETCGGGRWGACVGAVQPDDERCNAEDDDCDGLVDEGLFAPCDAPRGVCLGGVSVCRDGAYGPCEGADEGLPEVCNDFDDDCDGVVDEGVERACGPSEGRCEAGVQRCDAGVWRACEGAVTPRDEVCDGQDDDCDGRVDEAIVPAACGEEAGRCLPGVRRCVDGAPGPCEGSVEAEPEVCNGGDDDCDGAIDEGLDPLPCGGDRGICEPGERVCADGAWQACTGVEPQVDVCNILDDDCDGRIDEGFLGDRDGDWINDCAEERFGLDPDDPNDAQADFDHDGVSNANELRRGTDPWSMLYLYPVAGAPEGQRRVSVRLHAPEPDTRPAVIEVFVFVRGGAALVDWMPGEASLLALKDVVVAELEPGLIRATVVAPNLVPVATGELFSLDLSGPAAVRIDMARTAFAPEVSDADLQARNAAHRLDLEVP